MQFQYNDVFNSRDSDISQLLDEVFPLMAQTDSQNDVNVLQLPVKPHVMDSHRIDRRAGLISGSPQA